jgi:UDP-N-acetylmuramoyl-tripeptide--D-alanyl-D-alanine ligase
MPNLDWSLEKIAQLVDGTVHGNTDVEVPQVVIDSRADVSGALFVAIRGDRFDGHDFLEDVAQGGAGAALVEAPADAVSLPQIVVADTVEALQALGLARRWGFFGPVVAITGSSGKTTTRRILATVLGTRFATHQPIRNFNNHIGVPLTLLELEKRHEAAVIELGCSDFGEIATLTKCTDPDVALITNVGPAHLERLGDLNGVARAKGELFQCMRNQAVAIVNTDDPRVAEMPINAEKCVRYSAVHEADVRLVSTNPNGISGQDLVFDIKGETLEAVLPLIGFHNAVNALAATATAVSLGLSLNDIAKGLSLVTPEPGRLFLVKDARGALIIDDTYNANPASMRAALAALKESALRGRAFAVLGDMLELGEHFEQAHVDLGRHVAEQEIDFLITIGDGGRIIDRGAGEAGMPDDRRTHVVDYEQAVQLIREEAGDLDTVLVKGSRGMHMDKVVVSLVEKGVK